MKVFRSPGSLQPQRCEALTARNTRCKRKSMGMLVQRHDTEPHQVCRLHLGLPRVLKWWS